jgi:hypothetical protein
MSEWADGVGTSLACGRDESDISIHFCECFVANKDE